MKKIIFLIFINLNFNNYAIGNEIDCIEFKKYSSEYFNCKTQIIKNKAIALGKDFVEDTKKYQKEKFEEGKDQIEETKEQIEKTTDEILKK